MKYKIETSNGYPHAIVEDGITILHVNPSIRTREHIERIVGMLNELDAEKEKKD